MAKTLCWESWRVHGSWNHVYMGECTVYFSLLWEMLLLHLSGHVQCHNTGVSTTRAVCNVIGEAWNLFPGLELCSCHTLYVSQCTHFNQKRSKVMCCPQTALNCIILFLLGFYSIWSNCKMPVRHKPSSSLPCRPCLIYYYNHKDFRPTTSTIR